MSAKKDLFQRNLRIITNFIKDTSDQFGSIPRTSHSGSRKLTDAVRDHLVSLGSEDPEADFEALKAANEKIYDAFIEARAMISQAILDTHTSEVGVALPFDPGAWEIQ